MEVKTKKVGEFARVQGGFAFKSQEFTDSGIPVIKIKNVGTGSLNFSDYVFLKDEFAEEFSDYLTQSGDILISMTGSGPNQPGSLVGRVAYVKESDPICLINQRVGRLLFCKDPKIDPRFIFYILSSPQAREYLVSNATGSANQANINGKTIENFLVPDIGFEMSCQIADILGSLDDKIERNRQMNQTLETMAQAIFQSWFVDFEPVKAKQKAKAAGKSAAEIEMAAIVALSGKSETEIRELSAAVRSGLGETAGLFSDELVESELGLIPEGWEVSAFQEVAMVTMGQSPKGDTYNEDGEGVPLVNGPVEFGPYFTEKSKWTTAPIRLAKLGELIVCVRGSTTGRFVISDGDYCIGRGVCAIRGKASQAFANYTFKHHKENLLQMATGSTFPSWSSQTLKEFDLINPSLELVNMFDSYVQPLIEKAGVNVRVSDTLAQLRDSLLPKLLSGELTLPTAQTQATEALVP
jgi:type I restriction enzyme, S subunit